MLNPPQARGFVLDESYLQIDLYRLLAFVFASREYYKLAADTQNCGKLIDELLEQTEDREIERSLISSAISMRMIMDRNPLYQHRYDEMRCGLYVVYSTPVQSIPLKLRMACNTIIHSEKESFKLSEENDHKHLMPEIMLNGKYEDFAWHAKVDLIRYVKQGLKLIALL